MDLTFSRWETMKYDVKQFSLNFAKKFQKKIKQKDFVPRTRNYKY